MTDNVAVTVGCQSKLVENSVPELVETVYNIAWYRRYHIASPQIF